MIQDQHYSKTELIAMGFKGVGNDCLISRKASFYGIKRISLGDNVRIDDFAVLSAGTEGISIGNYIHIAVYTSLIGASHIKLDDFVNLSSRVSIYSSSDDYSGEWLTNPTIDPKFTNVISKPVHLAEHCIVGSGSVILPGVQLGVGVAVGALSLVTRSVEPFKIVAGSPARFVKKRSTALLDKAEEFKSTL
ncbi:acyltransferase [Pseudoalteromonas sp. T1lg65]|uniref:acyltransferase n=1 Tax=Pseudoalteromonas sp. T1lg65 TaxID=2077101 RepID=UPI003F79561D